MGDNDLLEARPLGCRSVIDVAGGGITGVLVVSLLTVILLVIAYRLTSVVVLVISMVLGERMVQAKFVVEERDGSLGAFVALLFLLVAVGAILASVEEEEETEKNRGRIIFL